MASLPRQTASHENAPELHTRGRIRSCRPTTSPCCAPGTPLCRCVKRWSTTSQVLDYRRNENFYTPSEGGYYSQPGSLSSGVALQMLSKEGRGWQCQGNFETEWNDNSLQVDERWLPLGALRVALENLTNAVCKGSHGP
jgi:hypothetical protein